MNWKKLILVGPILLIANVVFAQREHIQEYTFDSTSTYRIDLQDKTSLIGKFISRTDEILTLETASLPRVQIPFGRIVNITVISAQDIKKGKYWFPNPNATRYLFAPSAIPLKKGEGYFQNTYIFINSVNFAITNNISLGAGVEIASLLNGENAALSFFTPKIGIPLSEKFHVAWGLFLLNSFGETAGITYGMATYGSHDHNLSLGLGKGIISGNVRSKPVFTLNGMTRLSQKAAVITENWFIPPYDWNYSVYSLGLRFFGEKMAVDLAVLRMEETNIPFVDFVIKW